MKKSFRRQLAVRFTATMTAGVVAMAVLGYLALRQTLDRQIEASLVNVASIQASSVTADPTGRMEFHEWNLTPEEAASVRELVRYGQIWSENGESLLRSQFLARDLPLDSAALATAAAGQLAWTEQAFRDGEIRSLYYPLGRLGESHARHVLQVSAPLGARNRTLRRAALFLAAIALLVSAGTFAGSWWLAGRAVRPVRDITRQAEEIGAESLGRRITAHADTVEYERLVEVLNTMLDRLDEAFEAQRRFVGDASHELRSPLTALRGELELALRQERSPEEYRRVIASALEETEHLTRLSEDLLTLARSDAGVIEPRLRRVDLGERARRVVDRLRRRAGKEGIDLCLEDGSPVEGLFDPELVDRMLRNLVENAVKFTGAGGEVRVRARTVGGTAVLEVADTGPGLPDGESERLFERFYRGDAARHDVEGTGLGLSIVRAVARTHGGRVELEDRDGAGAVFRVVLPVDGGGTERTSG